MITTEIWFPGLYFPDLVIKEGWLCDVWILNVHVVIPPTEIFIASGFWIWREFLLFDTAWITDPVKGFIDTTRAGLEKILSDISLGIDDVKAKLGQGWEDLGSTVVAALSDAEQFIKGTILNTIWGWLTGALDWATDCLNIINDNVMAARTHIDLGLEWVQGLIIDKVDEAIARIPQAVWTLFKQTLDDMAAEYYATHSEKEES